MHRKRNNLPLQSLKELFLRNENIFYSRSSVITEDGKRINPSDHVISIVLSLVYALFNKQEIKKKLTSHDTTVF